MKKVIFLILNFTIISIFPDDNVSWYKTIDWNNNRININIKSPLDQSDTTLASSRRRAENWIEDNKTNIFFNSILDIEISSLENVSEIINRNPEIYFKLDNLAENLDAMSNKLSTNLEFLDTLYSIPIYPDFISVFYSGSEHLKRLKKLDHREYGEYTGLIIYVPDNLPLYQKSKNGELKKVLLPKIYNENMSLVMDYTMVDPEYIKKWGVVIYGDSFNENIYQNRVGVSPLRIIAKGIFGKNNSDIIISNREADMLIGTQNNLNIVNQGRILILKQENYSENK